MRWALATTLLSLALAPGLGAQLRADEVPLEDLLELVVLDHEILAIDAGGGQTAVALELGEEVSWRRSRGKVGVVLTDRRILAVGTSSAAWQESRYRRTETPSSSVLLGDRVALVQTSERVLGFAGAGGRLIEYRLGPQEQVLTSGAGANTAVVLTNRKVLGLSGQLGRFVPADLELRESLVELTPRANVATVRTNRRILIFRAPTGSWEEKNLELGDRR